MKRERAGLALLCDPQGNIEQLLRDDLDVAADTRPGHSFLSLLAASSIAKGREFLAEIQSTNATFDWELDMRRANGVTPLHCAGGVVDANLLIVGAPSCAGLSLNFYAELMHINNLQLNAMRALVKEQSHQVREQEKREAQDAQLYDELSRLNNQLVATQRELTKKNVQFATQREELARSNAELEQFAYVISHDLQEPLRMVAGHLQLLERRYAQQLDAKADQYIHYAVDGAGRMQAMIQALLDLSRVKTQGREPAPTDCETVLANVLRDLDAKIQESRAEITHDPLPTVRADETQLGQVFQNLIANAIKFRGERPPRVHVSAKERNGAWLFRVRDNGIGIDPAQSERIFQIFQRLHTEDEYPGTGIGLAICQKIVRRHGGRIWIESEPGRGSTFCFTLPGG